LLVRLVLRRRLRRSGRRRASLTWGLSSALALGREVGLGFAASPASAAMFLRLPRRGRLSLPRLRRRLRQFCRHACTSRCLSTNCDALAALPAQALPTCRSSPACPVFSGRTGAASVSGHTFSHPYSRTPAGAYGYAPERLRHCAASVAGIHRSNQGRTAISADAGIIASRAGAGIAGWRMISAALQIHARKIACFAGGWKSEVFTIFGHPRFHTLPRFPPNRFPLSGSLASKPELHSAYFPKSQLSTLPGESPCLGRLMMLHARGNSDSTEK
jgi:hypothetical protein